MDEMRFLRIQSRENKGEVSGDAPSAPKSPEGDFQLNNEWFDRLTTSSEQGSGS
jgi:hypothetical protein